MKAIIIYLLGSISLIAQSFDLLATYTLDLNTDFPNSHTTSLFINSNENISYYILDFGGIKENEFNEDSNEIIVRSKNTDNLLIYNKLNEFIISQELTFNDSYWVKESLSFDWEITNETKESDGYVMQKATTTFRGRDYIAWFTKEIPIPMGPYKFYGLPGLILEIYDTDNIYHWTITKIEENKTIASNNLYPEHHDFLSMKQFVEKKENSDNQIDASILSRLPKGVNLKSVQSTTVPVERKGIEIKFEWEED